MADKELKKLKRRELLQMLLIQCEETERLQQETDEMREQMDAVMESYERLKQKLNIKDERLNEKDAKIAELKLEIEELKTAKELEAEDAGSVSAALSQLGEMFEEVQKSVQQYVDKSKKSGRKQQSPYGQIVQMNTVKTGCTIKQKEALLAETKKASGEI